jgi:hypothetical protein
VATLLVIVSWPYLGSNFPAGIYTVLQYSRAFPFLGDTLYAGRHVSSVALPWHYLPVWILVTTPVFILALSLAALRLLRSGRVPPLTVLLGGSLAFNLALYYGFRPVIYDGLRHFLYLLPILAVLAAVSLIELVDGGQPGPRRPRALVPSVVGLVALNGVLVVAQCAALHPYEYVYFNELTGYLAGASGRFETDYWAASNREAVLWLRNSVFDRAPREAFTLHACGHPYQSQHYLPGNVRWVDRVEDADYFLCVTRENPLEIVAQRGRVIHTVGRTGVALNYVFEMSR